MSQSGKRLIAAAQEAVEIAAGRKKPARFDLIWTDHDSTNIRRTSYDSAKRELVVQFKSGIAHVYEDVDEDVMEEMREAPSVGAYFARNIRPVYETYAVEVEADAPVSDDDEPERPLSPRELEDLKK